MHISEGILSAQVLIGGGILGAAGTAIGLKKMDYDKVMSAAIMSAAFFVASLIHVPIGPTSAHLLLNGLLGVILGWAAFPAILTGLLLQAVLFQYGGLTVLCVNTFNMAAPAVLCWYIFAPFLRRNSKKSFFGAFCCGVFAVFLSTLFTATSLALSGESFIAPAKVLVLAHLPIMLIEGIVTGFTYTFLARVKPEVLQGTPA